MNHKKGNSVIPVLIIVILLVAGGYYVWKKASEAPVLGQVGDVSTSTGTTEPQRCMIVVDATTTLYTRPSTASQKFGELTTLDQNIIVGGKTADGWLGFDPGVAQAPNVGPFRLRYIPPNSPITLVGSCDSLPVVGTLPPTQCFIMAESDIPIYQNAATTSTIVATMHFGDYIDALGKKGSGADYFVKVLSIYGTLASGTAGYISSSDVNFNGACDLKSVK